VAGGALRKEFDSVAFIARHGIVLASAKGPVSNIAEAVAGEIIRGSWWAHKKGKEIFNALASAGDSSDVLCFRLIDRKVTYVDRRLWPALVRLADEIGAERLTAIAQKHTVSGAHRIVATPFPNWVRADIAAAAKRLSAEDARTQLGPWYVMKDSEAFAMRRVHSKKV
jgi:hypothetical protein